MPKDIAILYVEDDMITNKMVSNMLRSKCQTLYSEFNGLDGFNTFHKESPDIIITDLSMPQMDGFKMIQKIRETAPKIPILVTTAYREETETLLNVTIIKKPISRKELIDSLDKAIQMVKIG